MSSSILRQIKDIQVQAERLLNNASPEDYQDFARYSKEIKTFLMENVDEEMILKFVREIPEPDASFGSKSGNSWFFNLSFVNESRKSTDKQQLRNIRDKYASIEFLCKNYFQ